MPTAELRGREFQRILLIKFSATGDVVQTVPVLNKLRRRYPHARIDWLMRPGVADLLQYDLAITNVVPMPREDWSKPWRLAPYARAAQLVALLRSAQYDLVVDLQGQLRSAVFAFATGAPVRIGFDRPRASAWAQSARRYPEATRKHAWQGAREGAWLAYTHHIAVPNLNLHAVDRYLGVVPMLGLDDGPADFSFPIPDAASDRVEVLLRDHDVDQSKLVVMAPGTVWETKQWPPERFAAVARHCLEGNLAVVLIGSDGERALCESVRQQAPGTVNIAGETTLSELAALLRMARLCISNDSGPMHLAVALGRPVVSIFGPTSPLWAGPYHRPDAVVRADVPCAPCYLRLLARCPHDHACMQEVAAQAVIARVDSTLAAAPAAAPNPIQAH